MIDTNGFLMIEPTGAPTAPIVDDLTRKVAGMMASAEHGACRYRGIHRCTGDRCRANSDNVDWFVGRRKSNSLAVHYIACHRDEVPEADLALIAASGAAPADPTPEALAGGARQAKRSPVYR